MELWIRSTARTNLLKIRFLTIMDGKKFYKEDEWEFKGYTICNCTEQGNYELLGTYKSKERALEVLDMIQEKLINLQLVSLEERGKAKKDVRSYSYLECVFRMPKE